MTPETHRDAARGGVQEAVTKARGGDAPPMISRRLREGCSLLAALSHSSFPVSRLSYTLSPFAVIHTAIMLAPCLRRTVFRPLLVARVPRAGASFSTFGVLRRDARATYSNNNMTGNYTDVYVSMRSFWHLLCRRTDVLTLFVPDSPRSSSTTTTSRTFTTNTRRRRARMSAPLS